MTRDEEQGLCVENKVHQQHQEEKVAHQASLEGAASEAPSIVSSFTSFTNHAVRLQRLCLALVLVTLGAGVASAFLSVGILHEREDERHHFEQSAIDVANSI